METYALSSPAPVQPLTGLARLFLAQLYVWVLGAFLSHLVLNAFIKDVSSECMFWSACMLALGVFGLVLLVGMHTRASYVPRWVGHFCIAGMAFTAIVMLRIVPLLLDMDMRIGESYYDALEMYSLIVWPCFAVNLPLFYAWRRYFTGSTRMGSIFGSGTGNDALPPLGVGLLQVLCGMFALFYLFFMVSVLMAVEGPGSFKWLMAAVSAPGIVFPLILLGLVWQRGPRRKAVAVVLLAWLLVQLVWSHAFGFRLLAALELERGSLYMFMYTLRNLPLGLLLSMFACGLLAWRFFTVEEEAAWFNAPVRSGVDTVSLCTVYVLFFVWNMACAFLVNTGSLQGGEITKFALTLILCIVVSVLGIMILRARFTGKGQAGSIAPTFFGLVALSFATAFVAVLAELDPKQSLWSVMLNSASYYITPICLAIFGLYFAFAGAKAKDIQADSVVDKSAKSGRLADMPPLLAFFGALAFSYLLPAVWVRLARFVLSLNPGADDSLYGQGAKFGAELFLSVAFWLACLCAVLLYLQCKKRLPGLNQLRALCVLLLACTVVHMANGVISTMVLGGYYSSQYYLGNLLLNQETQAACVGLVLLMFYAAGSKEVEAWRKG